MSLTIKQEKFAQKYIELGNASEAYRQSYNAENMSDDSIHVNASKLLSSAKVSLRVNELKLEHQKRHQITVEQVLNEYKKLALFDIRKLYDDNGDLLHVTDLEDGAAAAISGIEVAREGGYKQSDEVEITYIHKYKTYDKRAALNDVARILGMFEKDNEQSKANFDLRSALDALDGESAGLPTES